MLKHETNDGCYYSPSDYRLFSCYSDWLIDLINSCIYLISNPQIVTYDSPRGGIRVTTRKEEQSTSFLLIENAQPSDSGVYQCNPSNAKSKSVTVHVLNGNVIEFIYSIPIDIFIWFISNPLLRSRIFHWF